jgi:hypothetical protein
MGKYITHHKIKYLCLFPRFPIGWQYAYPNGTAVSRYEPHKWRHINGIFIRFHRHIVFVQWRRHFKVVFRAADHSSH